MVREPLRYNTPIVDGGGRPNDYFARLWQFKDQRLTRSIAGSGPARSDDYLLLVDASGGAATITLPPVAKVNGAQIIIKKTDASANAVTIEGDGAETIDGAANQPLPNQYDALTVFSDGAQWWIV